MINALVFELETVPDVEAGRRLYQLGDLDDEQVAKAMFAVQAQKGGGSPEALPLHLHRVVAIAVVMRRRDNFKVWSLGELDAEEEELVHRFYDGIGKLAPTLVSWNGTGFHLPVLHYRALRHGIAAPRYWDTGEGNPEFRYNNYVDREHRRHLDLMQALAGGQGQTAAGLDDVATMLGFPGNMGNNDTKVWDTYLSGDIESIRDGCEARVLNTYLVYLRFERMRGQLTAANYEAECDRVRKALADDERAHLQTFVQAWQGGDAG